ncbi:membrane dipeptidase (peptidase family M19) [Herbihabitans rhizosphaerae]|uniref:Membrane dipeptidase (Peptidase family M19) n=1 Tax=Herbihabitans rhizosphaerae TaxID=1872711 RepID=A0A4Q7KP51_9PSEU|nr:membrane dipeptidase [Herbihabitans rhizosphaerae]RZS37760.1 membrane dipeptidase (peptidase family M19) [Herbihabitans rhizosphaerae]
MTARGMLVRLVAVAAGTLLITAPGADGAPAGSAEPLDGGCFAVKSVGSGKYVATGALGNYDANAAAPEQVFRLRATDQGRYLLYGTKQDFIAAAPLNLVTVPAKSAGPATEWRIDPAGDGYTLTSTSAGKQLATVPLVNALTLRNASGTNDNRFRLEPASGCADIPEAELNLEGPPVSGTTPDGEVRGLLDMHNHLTMFEGIGGRTHCGKPWSGYGITDALRDCPDHEPAGLGAWWENVSSGAYPSLTHDTTGWPTFRDWPKWNQFTHEGTYYKWLERAWRGGLRVYTNHFVNNAALCEIYPLKKNSCDDRESIRLQSRRIHELQDFVDAQHGGVGRGWFRIVTDPAQARQIVAQGKLAVVLAVEMSQPFGCGIKNGVPQCTAADIDKGLDELHSLGVRQMFLCHKYDNALCGVRFDGGVQGIAVNAANFYSTGRFWQAETCTGPAHDNTIEFNNPLTEVLVGPLAALVPLGVTLPVYPKAPHCNINGLTDLGAHAVRGLIARNMILDIDHMSVKAADATLKLLEDNKYAGVVSGHSWMEPLYQKRLYALGGIATSYGHESSKFVEQWRKYKAASDPKYLFGFGAGFDTNGYGTQPPPRANNASNKVRYPFTSFDGGTVIDRQRTGQRVYDVNTDGFAHYGLLPDWVEDLRLAAGPDGPAIMTDMARGAETYLRMWARATE